MFDVSAAEPGLSAADISAIEESARLIEVLDEIERDGISLACVAGITAAEALKGVSSRRMRQEFPELAAHYYRADKLWSGSYFAGSAGGAPLSTVHQYIEQQNHPA